MTFSNAERIADLDRTLRVIMLKLGDQAIADYNFRPSDLGFEQTLATTWDDLRRGCQIRAMSTLSPVPFYTLTGTGWIGGLKLTGQITEAFRQRIFTLVALLKDRVKGRTDDACATTHDFEGDGISSGLVFNVVESGIIEEIILDRIYELRWLSADPWGDAVPFFSIPRTLGQQRLTL